MSYIPGTVVSEFTTKSGKKAVIRYPKWEDLPDLLQHINTVSKENTYITFSGEEISLEEEAKYLASEFVAMEMGRAVKLFCYVENVFAGVCDIHQNLVKKERSKHMGTFGLVISKDFRGDGVGKVLAQATIDEAKKNISGLKLIWLECYSANIPAHSLYEKLGFKDVAKIPGALLYKGEYTDEVQMVLPV